MQHGGRVVGMSGMVHNVAGSTQNQKGVTTSARRQRKVEDLEHVRSGARVDMEDLRIAAWLVECGDCCLKQSASYPLNREAKDCPLTRFAAQTAEHYNNLEASTQARLQDLVS